MSSQNWPHPPGFSFLLFRDGQGEGDAVSARSCKKRTGYDSEGKIDGKNPGVAAVNFAHLIRWELPKRSNGV
jgi:hypothetical protein